MEYSREYYFNPETEESIWEIPKDVIVEITDCTDGATEAAEEKSQEKKQEGDEEEVDQRILDFKAQTIKHEQAQKEALEELYPEYYEAADKTKTGIETYEP